MAHFLVLVFNNLGEVNFKSGESSLQRQSSQLIMAGKHTTRGKPLLNSPGWMFQRIRSITLPFIRSSYRPFLTIVISKQNNALCAHQSYYHTYLRRHKPNCRSLTETKDSPQPICYQQARVWIGVAPLYADRDEWEWPVPLSSWPPREQRRVAQDSYASSCLRWPCVDL